MLVKLIIIIFKNRHSNRIYDNTNIFIDWT